MLFFSYEVSSVLAFFQNSQTEDDPVAALQFALFRGYTAVCLSEGKEGNTKKNMEEKLFPQIVLLYQVQNIATQSKSLKKNISFRSKKKN